MEGSTIFRRLTSFLGFSSPTASFSSTRSCRRRFGQVDRRQHLADRLGADLGGEAVLAVLVLRVEVLVFGQQLAFCLSGVRPGSMTT
jgi:hypothetical protein